ncbi:MAG: hypothetical protein ACETWG_10055, partial [Candidatus Neomarinimicrobiota bacterium]
MKRDFGTFIVITRPLAILRGLALPKLTPRLRRPPLFEERGLRNAKGVSLLPSALLRACLSLALALPLAVLAQTYDIPASVVGSGSTAATSTSYSLSGTVGQAGAGLGLTSASYGHDAGFWPVAQALSAPAGLAGVRIIDKNGGAGYDFLSFTEAVNALV